MIAKGDIYESKNYHNVVFVGRDKEQNPRYAAMRGTDENRYRGEARGSEKAYGFGHIGTDEKLFVFESPIDLLSYITAVPEEWEKHSYISLGGLSEKAMKRMYNGCIQNILRSIPSTCVSIMMSLEMRDAGSLFLLFRRNFVYFV